MVIRPQQMEAFHREARQRFEVRLAAYLRDRYAQTPVPTSAGDVPVAKLPPAVIEKMVAFGVDEAQGYGLRTQPQLTAFVTLMFLVGPAFHRDPRVSSELHSATVPDSCRMDHVCSTIPQEVWHDIRSRYDAGSWIEAGHLPAGREAAG